MKKFISQNKESLLRSILLTAFIIGLAGAGWGQVTLETFNSTATLNLTQDVTDVTVQVWGAGGRGGTRTSNGAAGGGGGGGYSEIFLSSLPAGSYTVTVGTGGNNSSINGGSSWFINTSTVLANGGTGVDNNTTGGGTGAVAGVGDVGKVFTGGNGGNGATGTYLFWAWRAGGGGGSSAGTSISGNNAVNASRTNQVGAEAPTGGGNGGNGAYWGELTGTTQATPSDAPGGGGGGGVWDGNLVAPSNGANGLIVITYTIPECENGTLALSSTAGTDAQIVCENSTITNITYTVGGDATGATVSGLPAGVSGSFSGGVFTIGGTPTEDGIFNYTVTTTGVTTPCTNASANGSITVNALPTFTHSKSEPDCFGAFNGTITLTASNGSGTYQYSKDAGVNWQSSNVFSGLGQGNYTIQVKDSNGCIQTNCSN